MRQFKVKYMDIAAECRGIREELLLSVSQVLDSGKFILGPEVDKFERHFSEYCGTRFAVGVANGTDALMMALRALGIGDGDEVITVANSFLSTVAAIAMVGAKPVLVDARRDFNIDPDLVKNAISDRTRAILPVHLTGRPADMHPILEIAKERNLHVIEDAAQAIGAAYHGDRVGSFGILGCFSLHPLKNLGACGDAGVITTNDETLHDKLLKMRNHGLKNRIESEFWSVNSRLDSLQAALLNVKFNFLDQWTEQRRDNARFYQERLRDVVYCPTDQPYEQSVYHTFVIQADRRDALKDFLEESGIETKIHYPIPIHLQPAARDLGYQRGDLPITEQLADSILSLPVQPALSHDQKELVVGAIREFYSK